MEDNKTLINRTKKVLTYTSQQEAESAHNFKEFFLMLYKIKKKVDAEKNNKSLEKTN